MDQYQTLLQEKAKNKRKLLGQMFFPRNPVVLIDLYSENNSKKVSELLEGLNEVGIETIVVPPQSEAVLPTGAHLHYISPEERQNAEAAADFMIVFDSEVEAVWNKGCVPIAQQNGQKTINYNPLLEKGNGFYFKNPTKWEIFAAIVRALETYQFPYDWENLVKEILKK